MSCGPKSRIAERLVACKAMVAISGALFWPLCADMAKAQSQPSPPVQLHCSGANDVPAETQEMLCAGLQSALATKYPSRQFTRSTDTADKAKTTVTLQTFVANTYGMELRLGWRTPDRGNGEGPRLGFSIVDKAMTADMQLKFLNRVVQDTALPF